MPAPPDQRTSVPRGPRSKNVRFGWVLEIVVVRALVSVYDWARDQLDGSSDVAYRHARDVIDAERALGIYHEETIQEWFLPSRWFIGFWNIFYGSIHFVMPVIVLVWLYRKAPARYVRWRNTALWMLGLGLVGFWLYPLMPPRLLPESFGFVDTRLEYFGMGKPATAASQDNLYAAMPSLHIGWSTWCAIALWPLVRRPWAKALLVAYPVATLFGTVVTGNHYLLDAVGGWIALAIAWQLATPWVDWRRRAGLRGPSGRVGAGSRD